MRILGVDPGLEAAGYGVIEIRDGAAPVLVEAGLIRTRSSESFPKRLAQISQEIQALLAQHHPSVVAVEDLYSYYKTPKPAILMGHVRGVVLAAAAAAKVPVQSYLPTRIKRAVVGRGHASKLQIIRLVQMRLNLAEREIQPDVADALAAALCHADTVGKRTPFALSSSKGERKHRCSSFDRLRTNGTGLRIQ